MKKLLRKLGLEPDPDKCAFDLEPGQIVGCYICMQQGDHSDYRRGEAFLCSPGRYGEHAHYICKRHLDKDIQVFDPYAKEK